MITACHDSLSSSNAHYVPLIVSLLCWQMYGLIWLTDLRAKIDSIDLLIMLTSAVCHDLDHTGYNNAYQVRAVYTRVLQ